MAISKEILISLFFVTLIFAVIGVNMETTYAYELDEDNNDLELELDDVDKLENSQNDEIVSESHSLNGGTFKDIQNKINKAKNGDVIDLSGEFTPDTPGGYITLNKSITLKSSTSATLNGMGNTQIMYVKTKGAESHIENLKFINGYSIDEGGALRIFAKSIEITNCVFENNYAVNASGALHTSYTPRQVENIVVKNCQFTNNSAGNAGGALGVFGYNFLIENCTFQSNHVNYNTNCYGGAVQVGMDTDESYGVIKNSKFVDNYAKSEKGISHGGAGCVRNGTSYINCFFQNNVADHGGALTYHASGSLENCEFYSNNATLYGGAVSISLEHSTMDLFVNNCSFNDNTAPLGGAMRLSGMNININDSTFNDNLASDYGGAISIDALNVSISNSHFNSNIANIDGGAVNINGQNTQIINSDFVRNNAIPDENKLDDGLGGAIYVNSKQATIKGNTFHYNTARNGSAIYYGSSGENMKLENNVMFQNQAWVYALPIYVHDIYYGESEQLRSIIYGGNNIAKYTNLAVSNAIYNAALSQNIKIDGETPVSGATDDGSLYQDDREYNMGVLLTVMHQNGNVVYNQTLSSSYLGEVSDVLTDLEPGEYYVTSTHYEDTYYKGISNSTSFKVYPKVDSGILKSASQEDFNYGDNVMWTLTIVNNGPNTATNVVVNDVLPNGLRFISSDNGDYDPSTGSLTIDSLAIGQKITINILTEIRKTGVIVNHATVTCDEYDIDLGNNQDDSTIYVNSASDLEITKSVSNQTPNYNDVITWSVVVKNNGPDCATGVEVSDVLPKSLIWLEDNSNGRYNPETGLWEIGELANGTSIILNIVCQVNGTGLTTNYASVRCNEYDYNPVNNYANKSIDVKSAVDLSIEKLVNDTNPNYLDLVKWTLIISNNGPDNASDIVIDEVIPNGLTLINHTASKGIYDNGVWAMCCLNKSEVQSLELVCRVDKTGYFNNVASISSREYDYNPGNNRAEKSIDVPSACDLELIKTVNEENVDFGDTIIWMIMVRNNGPDVATNVVVSEVLSSKFTFKNYTSTKGTYYGGEWQIGSLSVGGVEYLNITGVANEIGGINNYAEVSANEYDWNESNNYDSSFVSVESVVDLAIDKFVSNSTPNYGDTIKWTLIVTNNGPNDASNVVVYDVLPDGFSWDIGSLNAGDSVQLELICKVSATGSFINNAEVSGDENDPDLSNNKDSSEIYVRPASDLAITKIATKYNYRLGELVNYRIEVVNNGPDMVENIKVDEILDSSLSLRDYKASMGDFDEDTKTWSIDSLGYGEAATLLIKAAGEEGISENRVSVSGDNYDPDLTNNEDTAIVEVSHNPQNTTKIPKNHEITKNMIKNKYHVKAANEILKRNVSGNSIFVLLISLILTMVFLGNGISNRR